VDYLFYSLGIEKEGNWDIQYLKSEKTSDKTSTTTCFLGGREQGLSSFAVIRDASVEKCRNHCCKLANIQGKKSKF
jgi:hypothetical protein